MKDDPRGEDAWDRLAYRRGKRSSMEGIASEARSGDRECAMTMIRAAEAELDMHGKDIDLPVREYLLDAFSQIVSGTSPDKAFNLERKSSGRPEDYWRMVRDSDIACAVKHRVDQGMMVKEACAEVADTYTAFSGKVGKVGTVSVKKAYQRFFPESEDKE